MPENQQSQEIKTGGATYVGWRGELLAELALARVPELSVHKPKEECGYDFLVASPSGVCFFVLVKALSSRNLRIRQIEEIDELRWRIDTQQIRRAQEGHTPVFIFLIDADTDHGRYLRLDTVHVRSESSDSEPIRFPRENTIDQKGIERLVRGLEKSEQTVSHQ